MTLTEDDIKEMLEGLTDVRVELTSLVWQLKRIADRLDAWDQPYGTSDGRQIHQLRTVGTVYPR